ncbi:MAG: hypothetical protein SNJ74_06595 [Fimbriimonadaceae bacterium]
MFLVGDILALVGAIFLVGVSFWSLTLAANFFFGAKAARAREIAESSPWKSAFAGVLMLGVAVILFGFSANVPNALAKLLGFVALLALLMIGVVGAAGLTRLLAARLEPTDPAATEFRTLSRATGLLVVAGFAPFVGWFFVVPAVLAVSLGAGLFAVANRPAKAGAVEPPAVQAGV